MAETLAAVLGKSITHMGLSDAGLWARFEGVGILADNAAILVQLDLMVAAVFKI